MANQKNDDEDKAKSTTTAARPSSSDLSRGQSKLSSVRDSLGRTGDPFLEDMQNIAIESGLDGNAQVNSPQASHSGEWSTGNSR
jgi:hypothetical protein